MPSTVQTTRSYQWQKGQKRGSALGSNLIFFLLGEKHLLSWANPSQARRVKVILSEDNLREEAVNVASASPYFSLKSGFLTFLLGILWSAQS